MVQPRRDGGRAAGFRHQPGLAREQPDRGEHLVLGHRDHVGHQLADVRERQRADLLHPERVRDRALDIGRGPADPLTAAEGLAGVRGEFRLDAHHGRGRASGPHGRRDARDQAAAADRHHDQIDLRAVGRDLQADRTLAGDDRPVVEGRDQHVPVPGHEFLGGGDRAAKVGSTVTSSAP